MKLAAFDLETARITPDSASDLHQYAPLGISCAALACADREAVDLWQDVPQLSPEECCRLVARLQEAVDAGYTLLTWNGCGFDFRVLAQESGLVEQCGELALRHVDLMLAVTFAKGYFLGLDKALAGAGLAVKVRTVKLSDGTALTGMSGVMAPRLWARGERRAVLEYLEGDVAQLLELARVIGAKGRLDWISNSGRPQSVAMRRFLTVAECFGLPEPDVSWMDNPPPRQQFVEWIPGWQEKVRSMRT